MANKIELGKYVNIFYAYKIEVEITKTNVLSDVTCVSVYLICNLIITFQNDEVREQCWMCITCTDRKTNVNNSNLLQLFERIFS